jgi:HAD superfamily hydrolase (TIGR01450 family)
MTPSIPSITVDRLIDQYAVLLLDAYGVLITHQGAFPGATELIDRLNSMGKPYFILTNDASRSPQSSAGRYQDMGLDISVERIITSGLLLGPYFESAGLRGSRCIVLGTEESLAYVTDAGGEVVSLTDGVDAETLVVCDERGYPLRENLDQVVSLLFRRIDRGDPVHLVLANPDLVYPAGHDRYGLTAGAVAHILEGVLGPRYPERDDLRFVRLGKPNPPMFEEVTRRAGTRDMIMVGDQLGTDIRGANRFGIDSALVVTGLARMEHLDSDPGHLPTYILRSLETTTD